MSSDSKDFRRRISFAVELHSCRQCWTSSWLWSNRTTIFQFDIASFAGFVEETTTKRSKIVDSMHKQPKVKLNRNYQFIRFFDTFCIFSSHFRQVLEEMEMISAFTSVLHVPNLSKPDHVLAVLEEHDLFTKQDLATLAKRMSGHKWVQYFNISDKMNTNKLHISECFFLFFHHRVFIGIKKLLDLIDMARQTEPQYRIIKFLTKLEEEGGLTSKWIDTD